MNFFNKYSKYVGWLIVAISFAFIAYKLSQEVSREDLVLRESAFVWKLLVSVFVYGVSGLLLAGAWERITCIIEHEHPSWMTLHSLYARTQIAKYIPGNVFQFAGRHVEMKKLGYGHAELALLTLVETGGLMIASIFLAGIGGMEFVRKADLLSSLIPGVLIVAAIIVIFYFLVRKLVKFSFRQRGNLMRNIIDFLSAIGLYVIFFSVAGLLLFYLSFGFDLQNIEPGMVQTTIGLFAVSWLAGYVIPGASAGAGIREALLIMGLEVIGGSRPGDAVITSIAMRIVTTGGDLIFFVYGVILSGSKTNESNRTSFLR